MDEQGDCFVGVDWASQNHRVVVLDAKGRKLGERDFAHNGEGLAAMAAWITGQTGTTPAAVSVAIEVPHGPVVESLLERGFRVHAINPKQLDRFRDRFSPAGAKDDNVLAFDYRSRCRACGVLNLSKRVGGTFDGYLFEVDDATASALNKREGHPNFYVREDVVVLDRAGHEVRAFTYRVPRERTGKFVAPNEDYLASCLAGRHRFALSLEDIEAAAEGRETLCTAVFVYGTLMRGERRASSWVPLRPPCVLLARAFGTLHHHGAYPGFVPARDGMVEGEFIRFDGIEAALESFDPTEGFSGFGKAGSLFRRTLVAVDVGGARARQA